MRTRLDLIEDLLQQHLNITDTASVKSDMMQEFEVVLTQMPYVGGAESRMSDFFMRLLGFMAIGRVLQRRGVPKDVIAELGRVDGFDQDECARQRDERTVIPRCLLTTQRNALESFEFADCLFDTGAALVENLWKESGYLFRVGSIRNGRADIAAACGLAV